MKACAIILAAGKPRHMERFSPQVKVEGQSILRRQVEAFHVAGVEQVIVVVGFKAAMVERHLQGCGVMCVQNREYAHTHMMESLQLGAAALPDDCGQVLVTPGDVPFLPTQTIRELLEAETAIAIPSHRRAAGHPVMIKKQLFEALRSYGGPGGLREFLKAYPAQTTYLDTDEGGVLIDVNTEEDVLRVQQQSDFRVSVDVTATAALSASGYVFDGRLFQILEYLRKNSSLHQACADCGISYTRAWTMLNEAERTFRCQLVERRTGGASGGSCTVTAAGEDLCFRYRKAERLLKKALARITRETFPRQE